MQINKSPTYLLPAQHLCILLRLDDLTDFKMRLLRFTAFALVGFLVAAPTSKDDKGKKDLVTRDREELFRYKAEHDIVKLVVPLNALLKTVPSQNTYCLNLMLFFVEADVRPDGSRIDQGLYVLKGGKATKILDYGRDAAASGAGDNSTKAFFGAKDGLYVYNPETNSADKYGPITDSIIAIDMEKLGEVIYILTEDRDVYKVTDNGEKKEKLDDVIKPKQIVLDYQNNLYFLADDKIPYVRTADGVKKIEGLPEATGTVTLVKAPVFLENQAVVITDYKAYLISSNGSSAFTGIEFQPKAIPTALAPEATLVQYYAYDKKIYEYNILGAIFKSISESIDNYFGIKQPDRSDDCTHFGTVRSQNRF
ncbi:uncharacterized protein LOC123878195 [Maniola jurtina]|uniref:uncharacterized protein LOC123878195 n=1 Tax=Maniola jurtina TaxID=191418 RepID=UPI001E68AE37|nr:uncharacterized protein LOC123878195 [Maniola jurtina]